MPSQLNRTTGYYLSYSFNFKHNISLEPYIGISKSIFEIDSSFYIPKKHGIIAGVAVNKHFKIKEFEFVSAFLNIGFSSTNFAKVHPQLGRGYIDFTFGIAYKGFYRRHFVKYLEYERIR